MSPEEVERVHQLTCVANDYLRSIGEYEDMHTLFNNPTLTQVQVSSLIEDIRNKWQVNVHASDDARQAEIAVDLLLFDIAIGNLIDNARKFGTGRTAAWMNIRVEKDRVTFDVIDDGPGIPPEEAEKVFRQFYKIDGNQTNAIKGCGLGLHVVRCVAKAHGGRCEVLAQRPSTLRLSLPMTIAPGTPHE